MYGKYIIFYESPKTRDIMCMRKQCVLGHSSGGRGLGMRLTHTHTPLQTPFPLRQLSQLSCVVVPMVAAAHHLRSPHTAALAACALRQEPLDDPSFVEPSQRQPLPQGTWRQSLSHPGFHHRRRPGGGLDGSRWRGGVEQFLETPTQDIS